MTDPECYRTHLDLSGPWELAFDPSDEGVRNRWMAGAWPKGCSEAVRLPALWNVTHPGVEGVGFYRRLFVAPGEWRGRAVRITCEGASNRADVWLNGAYVGGHEGAYTPFGFDVTTMLRFDADNELVMRVASL